MQINSHKHVHIYISKYFLKKNNNNKRSVEGDYDLDSLASGQGKDPQAKLGLLCLFMPGPLQSLTLYVEM